MIGTDGSNLKQVLQEIDTGGTLSNPGYLHTNTSSEVYIAVGGNGRLRKYGKSPVEVRNYHQHKV